MKNSQYLYADRVATERTRAPRWLDIGCGHGVVPEWTGRRQEFRPLAGIDLDLGALTRNGGVRWPLLANGEALPFRDGSFDLVTANMVLEHVEQPGQLFAEVARVLRRGGRFIAHTPNAYGYTTVAARLVPPFLRARLAARVQAREVEDVYPTFYRANTTARLREIAAPHALVLTIDHVLTSPQLGSFAAIGALESGVIRLLEMNALRALRPCLIVSLQKA